MAAAALIPLAIGLGVNLGVSVLQAALTPPVQVGRLDDLSAPKTSYGSSLAKIWGQVRVGGNVIWAADLEERKKGGKGLGPKVVKYSYYGDCAAVFCESEVQYIRRLWLNGDLVYDVSPQASSKTYTDSVRFRSQYFRFYKGTAIQGADGLLAAATGDSTAYRHLCYVVFENLPLEKFGNRYPAISAELITSGYEIGGRVYSNKIPLQTVVSDICLSAGLPAQQFDISQLSSQVTGFFMDEVGTDYRSYLQTLQRCYFFDAVETGGRIVFRPSKQNSIVTIPLGDLAATEYSASKREIKYFEEDRRQEVELPQEMSIEYVNPSLNYARDTRKGIRSVTGLRNQEKLSLSVVLTPSEATTIAHKLITLTWLERTKFKFNLPPKYLYLEAGDVVTIPFHGGINQEVKLSKVSIGANLTLECTASPHDNAIYDYVAREVPIFTEEVRAVGNTYQLRRKPAEAIVSVTNISGTTTYTPGSDWTAELTQAIVTRNTSGVIPPNTRLKITYESEETSGPISDVELYGNSTIRQLVSMPLLKDTDPDNSLYAAIQPGDRKFYGGLLSFSVDGGQSFTGADRLDQNTITGVTTTVLPTWAQGHAGQDNTGTVRVKLDNGSLSAKTSATPFLYWWMARIGSEIVRFRSAVLIAPDEYELSIFKRGQRGTDPFTGGHVVGEEFVLLDETIKRYSADGYPGTALTAKYSPANVLFDFDSLDSVAPVNFVNDGTTLKPLRVTGASASGTAAAGVTVSWQRRDRRAADAETYTNLPQSEASLSFEIEVRTQGNVFKRTLTSTTGSVVYPAASISVDFPSSPRNARFIIYQMSAAVGRGHQFVIDYTIP